MVANERIKPEDEPDGRKTELTDEEKKRIKLDSILKNLQDQLRFKDIYEESIKRLRLVIRNDPQNSHKRAELANAEAFVEESKTNIRALENEARLLTSVSIEEIETELRRQCASISEKTGIKAQEVLSETK